MIDFLLSLGVGVVAMAALSGVVWIIFQISEHFPLALPAIALVAVCLAVCLAAGYAIRSLP